MDVKQAVKIALEYIQELYNSEQIINLGLEEITFNDVDNVWEVTIGFSRPWDQEQISLFGPNKTHTHNRQYKIVFIDNSSQKVKSIKIREIKNA